VIAQYGFRRRPILPQRIVCGDIDVLAEDSGGWVVVELKKGEEGNNAVGQIKDI
jgi:Holliday junction resolvase-like predicted endonuclease